MEGIIHGVPGLVAQVAHGFMVVLDAPGHLGLDSLESRVSQIERDADERRPIGTSPLVAEINGRSKLQAPSFELAIELGREFFDARALDGETDVGYAPAKQRFTLGGPWITHAGLKGKG